MPNPSAALDGLPLRNAKATRLRGEAPLQELNSEAGAVLECARGHAVLEPKAMASEMDISHSLVLRGLKSGDLSFRRLWDLDDVFWMALLEAIARKRRIAVVRTTIEIGRIALVVIAVACSTGCAARSTTFRTVQASFAIASAADLHSTALVLGAGGHEQNKLLGQGLPRIAATKIAGASAELWLTDRLAATHPRLAAIVLAAVAGGTAVISWRNYKIAQGQQ